MNPYWACSQAHHRVGWGLRALIWPKPWLCKYPSAQQCKASVRNARTVYWTLLASLFLILFLYLPMFSCCYFKMKILFYQKLITMKLSSLSFEFPSLSRSWKATCVWSTVEGTQRCLVKAAQSHGLVPLSCQSLEVNNQLVIFRGFFTFLRDKCLSIYALILW